MNWHDLSEHTNTLVALLSLVATIAVILAYRLINGMDKKIDKATSCLLEIIKGCGDRRLQCSDDFVHQKDFDENWRPGRPVLWDAFNKHSHEGISGEGKVTRK